jgi:hypothetical protein
MDERMASLLMFKTVGIEVLLMEICPALYSIHNFVEQLVKRKEFFFFFFSLTEKI